MDQVRIGGLAISKMIIGGNPFSGFSHQGSERDEEMKHYYSVERIKQALREAERVGINTHIGRADHHVMRYLMEYWDEGGTLQWFAQTCPELGPAERGARNGITGGAKACYIHGGEADFRYAQGTLNELPPVIAMIRDAGMPAGIAGHNPKVFEWAEEHMDVDFYMCSYYNSAHRDEQAEHISGMPEWFKVEDRDAMVRTIGQLSKPVIHYKVLAAGRTPAPEAFAFVARHLRPQDAVCVGVHTKDKPGMLAEDVALLERALSAR
jgi:hypothetical protein